MPFAIFREKLRAKYKYHGIKHAEVTEWDTSRTCSACGNVDKKTRVHHGMHVCTNSKC
ncbi:MAG: zinc ribbon domain-containing protein [Candidatus Hodarchaeales archaeon]